MCVVWNGCVTVCVLWHVVCGVYVYVSGIVCGVLEMLYTPWVIVIVRVCVYVCVCVCVCVCV